MILTILTAEQVKEWQREIKAEMDDRVYRALETVDLDPELLRRAGQAQVNLVTEREKEEAKRLYLLDSLERIEKEVGRTTGLIFALIGVSIGIFVGLVIVILLYYM